MTITAQEYLARIGEPLSEMGRELLAALRHHEANEPDAALGALVRRILSHPMVLSLKQRVTIKGVTDPLYFPTTVEDFTAYLSHLDSLLPKEPEVVVKLGGRTWTFGTSPVGNTNVWWRPGDGTATVVASGELELALNALNALGGGK